MYPSENLSRRRLPVLPLWFRTVSFVVLVSLAAPGGLAVRSASGVTIRSDLSPASYVNLGAQPDYAGVGEIDVRVDGEPGPSIGSGTLVAPGWVLTAAHVLDGAYAAQFVVGGQTYQASRWIDYPKYTGDVYKGTDLALVQLSAPVSGIAPARLYRGHNEFNHVGTFVGIGETGTGATGATTDDRIKRAATNMIDGAPLLKRGTFAGVAHRLRTSDRDFLVDFDNPGDPGANQLGSPIATALEGLISFGDSGGPTFLSDPAGGAPFLAGIHSYGKFFDSADDSSYGDVTADVRVYRYASWIDGVIEGHGLRRLAFVDPTSTYIAVAASLDPAARRLDLTATTDAVPEPSGVSLLVIVLGSCALRRRRRR